MELKKKLSQLRKERGLTQLELAEALNVSRQAVSRWEVGAAVPTLDNLIFLSKLYGVPLDDLIQSETPNATALEETLSEPPAPPTSMDGSILTQSTLGRPPWNQRTAPIFPCPTLAPPVCPPAAK